MIKNPAHALSRLITAVGTYPGDGRAFNQWRDWDPNYDSGPEAPGVRLANLKAFLEARVGRAQMVACAEATGYQGGRFTGIPLVSERLLAGRNQGTDPSDVFPSPHIPRTSRLDLPEHPRVFRATRQWGFCEPTSTYVWRAIRESGADPRAIILWNAFPFHAHRADEPLTNRPLGAADLKEGLPFMEILLDCFPETTVVAVGRWAKRAFDQVGVPCALVRHPSQGGGAQFRREFGEQLASLRRRGGDSAGPTFPIL